MINLRPWRVRTMVFLVWQESEGEDEGDAREVTASSPEEAATDFAEAEDARGDYDCGRLHCEDLR